MTEGDIAEFFIHVANVERRLPGSKGDGPRAFGGYVLPVVHSFADMNGWGADAVYRDPKRPMYRWDRFCKLLDDDRQRYAVHRRKFWDGKTLRVTAEEMTMWEESLRITVEFIDKPQDRRALWAWAFAQAGGRAFARWCRKIEHVSEMTGHRRKSRALTLISAQLGGKSHLHDEIGQNRVLPCEPVLRQFSPTIEGGRAVYDTAPVHKLSWRDDPSFSAGGLTRADQRAAERRTRETAKRRQEKRAA